MSEADQAPPSNVEAERELLGSLLTYFTPDLFAKVRAEVADDDFYARQNEITWRAVCAVHREGGHVDLRTVVHFLAGHYEARRSDVEAPPRSFLEMVGGDGQMAALAGHAVVNGVVDRARIVHADAVWRRRLVESRLRVEACLGRDEAAWRALEGEAPRLTVVEGGKAAAS